MSGLAVVGQKRAATYEAMLPGRVGWVTVCHARPAQCLTCLGTIAQVLAEEMVWSLRAAIDRPVESYRAEIGAEECTLVQAAELRRLTCAWCYARQEMHFAAQRYYANLPVLADEVERPIRGCLPFDQLRVEDDGEKQRRHAAIPDVAKPWRVRGPLVSVQVKVGLWWLVGLILATMAVL